MYHLRLLGGASLEGPGMPASGRRGHRHQLALLALLAEAGEKGCSRDKLVAFLWPESDATHARHRLSDSLYELRQTLNDGIVVAGEMLRLNSDVIRADAIEFQEALSREDRMAAVRLYGGPFLDGFHLGDSREFEEWLGAERRRLADLYAKALEVLARRAEASGDPMDAAEWWKRLLVTDPFSSRVALRLIEALAAAGDPANAIQQARAHERLLSEEFQIEPPAELRALVEQLGQEAGRAGGGVGAAGRRTIAVLPFVNMSAEADSDYFSDGITEEVINALARIPDLRVTARTSAFQFKGRDDDVREIGRKLSVGTVLEGGVRKLGSRVRVTAQLIDVAAGYHLWSERFDRDLGDVFAIQDEIAAAIAERMRSQFAIAARPAVSETPAPGSRPDPAAYDAYLRGRYQRRQMFGGGDALAQALSAYREAIAVDPDFALAYSALAELQIVIAIGFGARPGRELMPEAKEAADRALHLDSTLCEAHLARALLAMYFEWDHAAAKAEIDRAIGINPSSVEAYFWAEFYYTYVARNLDKALEANRRAVELDPLDLGISSRLGQVLSIFGRWDEAIEQTERLLRIDPGHMASHLVLADAYSRKRDMANAAREADRMLELSPEHAVASVGMAVGMHLGAGHRERAWGLLQELAERARAGYVCPFWLAMGYAAFGDLDRAFAYLEQAQDDRDPNLLYLSVVPDWLPLRSDRRFAEVMRAIGLGHLVTRNAS